MHVGRPYDKFSEKAYARVAKPEDFSYPTTQDFSMYSRSQDFFDALSSDIQGRCPESCFRPIALPVENLLVKKALKKLGKMETMVVLSGVDPMRHSTLTFKNLGRVVHMLAPHKGVSLLQWGLDFMTYKPKAGVPLLPALC